MNYYPRIYVSCPNDVRRYLDPARQELREGILRTVRKIGFEPQEFGVSGIPQGSDWNFNRAREVMQQCDGALVIVLARYFTVDRNTSEYNHLEGGLAIGAHLPLLVIAEEEMITRGILTQGAIKINVKDYAEWLANAVLESDPVFQRWVNDIKSRRDVFFGYCSKASELAARIKKTLVENGISVMDWATDFRPGRTIMEEISRAAQVCRAGLFLFTADDPTRTNGAIGAVPRDNVLLEAGYFARAKSLSRVLIVREKDTNMPADLGGVIYLGVESRDEWAETANQVADSIKQMIEADTA